VNPIIEHFAFVSPITLVFALCVVICIASTIYEAYEKNWWKAAAWEVATIIMAIVTFQTVR
jgi:hypothetical protein